MRHQKRKFTLDRKKEARRALLLSLLQGLIKNKKIKTTSARAKFCQVNIEKIISMAKIDKPSARRQIAKTLPNKKLLSALFKKIAPKFRDRKGGYTRLIKLGTRQGDNASMAQLELLI